MTAAIVLSPTSGPVGTPVLVTGSGFAAISLMALTFGDVAIVPEGGAVTTNGSGAFSATIIVPESDIETVAVTATDASLTEASANFAVTGVNIMPMTQVSDPTQFLKAYKYGAPYSVEVNNDAYEDTCIIDARGCSEVDVQIQNTGSTNGLTYELYGLLEETASPPAFDATKYSLIGSAANVAALANAFVAITDPYSWILVRVKRQTSTLDTSM